MASILNESSFILNCVTCSWGDTRRMAGYPTRVLVYVLVVAYYSKGGLHNHASNLYEVFKFPDVEKFRALK